MSDLYDEPSDEKWDVPKVWLEEIKVTEAELFNKIDVVAIKIQNWIKVGSVSNEEKRTIKNLVFEVLCYWASNTYVGVKKTKPVREKFQVFFVSLYDLLTMLKFSTKKEEAEFAKRALYQGMLYRYLGHGEFTGDSEGVRKRIEPVYDGIYVSWSKNPSNIYFESKLYGQITYMICNTKNNYGIDLSAFGVSTGKEDEVVYPTIENCVVSVEYPEID